MPNALIDRLHERRDAAVTRRYDLIAKAKLERRDGDHLTTAEDAEFRQLTGEIRNFDDRIAELTSEDERSQRSTEAMRRIGSSTTSPRSQVYGPENRASYFGDMVAAARQTADVRARDRLAQYDQEQRDLNRADGSGGVFVPPAYLLNDVIGAPRPGRVTADLMTRRPLPPGTDVINIPKIMTGTATASSRLITTRCKRST